MSIAARKPVLPVVAVCAVLVGWFVWSATPALAVAPETPEVSVELPAPAMTATVRGVLDPGVEGAPGSFELGTYEFLYKQGKAGCEGEGKAPASPGISLGGGKEPVGEVLQGLSPGTEYMVCLLARSGVKGETSVSVPVAFTTAIPPETPVTSEPASSITATSATLGGVLNPTGKGEAGSYEFLYRQSASECQGEGGSGGSMLGAEKEVVSAEVSGLAPNEPYTFCLLARNGAGETALGSPVTFTTLSRKPSVSGESFSKVVSTGATISAQVDTGGLETIFTVQYGTTDSYGSETSVKLSASAGAASTQLSGLEPNTEYHFRVLVANGDGSEMGAGTGMSFTTLPIGIGGGLPDKREYEMVTPVDKESAEVYVPSAISIESTGEGEDGYQTSRITQAASNGNAVVYEGDPTHNGRQGSAGNGLGSAYISMRLPDGGWRQASLQYPGRALGFVGFSSDMSAAIVESDTENPANEEFQLPGGEAQGGEYHGEYDPYQDLYRDSLGKENYQPLFTSILNRTPYRFGFSTPPYEFGGSYPDNGPEKRIVASPLYAGGTEDLSQLLFGVNDSVLEGEGPLEKELEDDVKQEIMTQAEHENPKASEYLYDWSKGKPSLVDLLPDGKVAPDAVFGAPPFYGTNPKANPPDFDHVISTDGSRVFWTALEGEPVAKSENRRPKALYVRENPTQPQSPLNGQNECIVAADACTIEVDGKVGGGGRFWTASDDGSKVFFTASKSSNSLYEYDLVTGVTSDLTPGVEVRGVIGASSHGEYLYYADSANELYMVHENGSEWEAPTPIGELSPEDGESVAPFTSLTNFTISEGGKAGDWVPDIGQRTAEVTPNGRGLVFMSDQSLKAQGLPNGYQTDGQEEVYVYNATAKSLFCASCSQSGEHGSEGFLPISWSDSNIPTWISEDGDQVFFDSGSPLVSRDTNGRMDVYEWELEGTGSCVQGQGVDGGCVYLLSGGTGSTQSWLLGASASGSDVFMITRADLTPEAQDELYKVFDARVDGVQPVSPPACTGTGCQGVPGAPPVFATPSSVTYEGIGDFPPPAAKVKQRAKSLTRAQKLVDALRVCARKPKAKRVACRSLARSRYGVQGRERKSGLKRGRK